MKKLLVLIIAVTGFVTTNAQKLGHIDSQELLQAMPEVTAAQTKLEGITKDYENEILTMQQDFQTKLENYSVKAPEMPDVIRQKEENELRMMEQGLQEFQQTAQMDLVKQEETLLTPIIDKAKKAIQEVAKENGFTYVFDSSVGATVYNGGEDLMPLVKTKLGIL